MLRRRWKPLIGCLSIVFLAICPGPVSAQVRIRAHAFLGEPFGVGKLEVDLSEAVVPEPLGVGGLGVSEEAGRVLYPTVERRGMPPILTETLNQAKRPGLRLLGQVLDQPPGRTTVYFLFVGHEPLKLKIQSRRIDAFTLGPENNPTGYRRAMRSWWQDYSARPGLFQQEPDYPPVVDNYLRAMLARRLDLPLPRQPKSEAWYGQFVEELGLAAGTEAVRINYQRDRFVAPVPNDAADVPLPLLPPRREPAPIDPAKDVEIEPIATRVPEECLYVRYGSFANFLWFQDLLAQWGGDFQNMVATRGLDYGTRERFEKQLAVQTSAMARLFGGALVADVAIVGSDMFLREGGAFGLLFRGRNAALLGADFTRQRQERVQRGEAKETTVKIDGHDVSLLSSPDGRTRSFHVADGEYHFVTSSQTLARRFLETRTGKGSLGASPEFRHARSLMPLGRDDSVFIFLSNAFFENLTGPHYRVEMLRRMQAEADIELVQLALLASAAEGKPGGTIEQLAAGGFLPTGFGTRADGSRAVFEGGEVRDSLRGRRGSFLPVPDVEVRAVSRFEVAALERFREFSQSKWQRLDPITVAIKRQPAEKGRERVAIDLRMSPFNRQNYDTLMQWLGTPDKQRLAAVPGDSIALDVVLSKQRIFGGLRFVAPALAQVGSPLPFLDQVRTAVGGYLGSIGEPGLLALLDRQFPMPPDAAGYAHSRLGLVRWQGDPFTLYSFHREVLETVAPQLRFEEAERPAQIRVRANELSNSSIAPFLNAWGYKRTRETSLGNLRLMHQMTQQLHVPSDDARSAAEIILNARLVDPLAGKYEIGKTPDGVSFWTSTALQATPGRGPRPKPPEGYLAPPLVWFRGLKLDAALAPEALSGHAEIDMQMPAAER